MARTPAHEHAVRVTRGQVKPWRHPPQFHARFAAATGSNL